VPLRNLVALCFGLLFPLLGAAPVSAQAPPRIVAAPDAIVVDRSQLHGTQIVCIVSKDHSVWCSFSKVGHLAWLPQTCGFRIGDDFAAIVCRHASGNPFPIFHRNQPTLGSTVWAAPTHPSLLNLVSANQVVGIAGSQIVCGSPSKPPGAILCAIGARTSSPTWAAELTASTVAIGSLRNGQLSSKGFARPAHLG
jgi:hypothetical protein